MESQFDSSEAKENLKKIENENQALLEKERLEVLNRTTALLKEYFQNKDVEVFLVGSITVPDKFNRNSDIDIVIKNMNEDRFSLWAELERKVDRRIEVIIYEKCHFQSHVDTHGIKVI